MELKGFLGKEAIADLLYCNWRRDKFRPSILKCSDFHDDNSTGIALVLVGS